MGPAVAGDVTWDVTFSSKRPTRILYVVLGMSWKNIWVTGGGYNKTIISSLHAQRFAPPGTTAMLPKDSRRYGGTSRDGWILLLQ